MEINEAKHDDTELEYEIEDIVDNEPMHIYDCLYVGTIDAALNTAALIKTNIRTSLALLSPNEATSYFGNLNVTESQVVIEPNVHRCVITMDDALEEKLFHRFPAILNTLSQLVHQAKYSNSNVLVHCLAGRSRSPAILAAWILTQTNPRRNISDIINHLTDIRPWVNINSSFLRHLELFQDFLAANGREELTTFQKSLELYYTDYSIFPALDFHLQFISAITIECSKRVTVRLQSDTINDRNSHLSKIFPYSLVIATTGTEIKKDKRTPFAVLRINNVETCHSISDISSDILSQIGVSSGAELLKILKEFYPNVTEQSTVLVYTFQYLYSLSKSRE